MDNIENYTLKPLKLLQKRYEDYLEKTDGADPDFPMMSFGGKNGKKVKVKGRNAASEEINNNDENI